MRHAVTIVLAFLAFLCAVPMAFAQASGYRIQPGDTLAVTVLEDDSLNRQVLVTPDGRVSVPLAGTVSAGGQTVGAVERAIADRLASNFAVRPNVFVSVTTVAEEITETFPIYVLGRVTQPGMREVEIGTNLLQAVALAGGLDRFAATKRIQLRRRATDGQERIFLFNFKAVERGGAIESMITMREGDVILVPERRLFE